MDTLLILSRAVHFGSCLLLMAVYVVRLLIERPVRDTNSGRGFAAICLGLAAGSGFVWFWVAAAGMSGGGLMESLNMQLFQTVVTQTPPGEVWVLRGGFALVLAVVLCFPRGAWRWYVGAVLAAATVISLAWLGHAGAGEDGQRVIMLIADGFHLIAASFWPAGLVPFGLLLGRWMKAGMLAEARAGVRRFSAMSLGVVAVLALSGLVNSYFLLGSFGAFWTTRYGQILLLKLAIFAAMMVVAAWNLLVHKPRLETDPETLGAVKMKVWLEAGLGALVVAAVAVLGMLPPGNSIGG